MLARGLAGSFCGTAAANEAAAVCILPRQGYMLAHMRALHSGTVVLQRSWAIRAGVQPPAAELALPSMQEAAPHGAPLDLQGMWLAFLRILHHQGHFPQTGLDREAAIQEQREVKTGLLAFARSRPDILMALNTADVVAVAEVPLTSASSQSERKVTNADRRLKASFAPASPAPSQDPSVTSHRPPALQDYTAAELSALHGGQARVQGSEGGGAQHASTQDLVRVVWSWVAFPPHVIEGHSLGLVHALVRLLQRLTQLVQEPPRAELLQQAQRLATPTTAELQGANEGRAAVARERAEARMRRERLQLLRRSGNFLLLSPGDWLCCNCGAANFRRRSACVQCGVSAHLAEHSEITPEDIRALVDTTRTSPLGGDPRQQQQQQGQQENQQQQQQGQQKQQGQQENQQQGQQQQQQRRWLAPRAGVRDGHSSWRDRMGRGRGGAQEGEGAQTGEARTLRSRVAVTRREGGEGGGWGRPDAQPSAAEAAPGTTAPRVGASVSRRRGAGGFEGEGVRSKAVGPDGGVEKGLGGSAEGGEGEPVWEKVEFRGPRSDTWAAKGGGARNDASDGGREWGRDRPVGSRAGLQAQRAERRGTRDWGPARQDGGGPAGRAVADTPPRWAKAEGDSDNETGTDGVKKSTGRSSALVARPRLSGNRRKLVDASNPVGDKYFAQERH